MSASRLPPDNRRIAIRDVAPTLIDDLIAVCSKEHAVQPIHTEGARIKREWLTEVIRANGPIAKIAYLDRKPAAQLMFYPEDAGPRTPARRDVIVLYCVYTGAPEHRRQGLGSALLENFLEEVRTRKLKAMAGRQVRFIRAPLFDSGEGQSMSDLYRRFGFAPGPDGTREMYLEVHGKYERAKARSVTGRRGNLLPSGRALVFYTPHCQWSYVFADQMAKQIREASPKHEILFVDSWRDPAAEDWPAAEAVIDGCPIYVHVTEGGRFRDEVAQALGGK
ncbi:MAG TPA: GNAT family N-acetyltransferase [Bacillota bacterium]|jgi:GNAT superfamily N-acetyltransferase